MGGELLPERVVPRKAAGHTSREEHLGEFVRGGPVLGAGGEAVFDHRTQPGRYAVECGLTVCDPEDDRGHVRVVERAASARAEGQDRSEAEHVRGRYQRTRAVDVFGRDVAGAADHHPGPGQLGGLECLGDPEVDHLGPVGTQQDVPRLEVPVQHPHGVHVGECQGEARTGGPHHGLGQRAGAADRLGERRARDVLRGEPGCRAGGVPRDEGCGVGTAYRTGRRDLAAEADPESVVEVESREHGLERHEPGERCAGDRRGAVLAREVHLAHAARAEQSEEPVGTDAGAAPGRQGSDHDASGPGIATETAKPWR